MTQYKIKTQDGYLMMDDLPHNCIFNKVVTGCGGSTIALRNDENYVIAVPTTELIINKLYPSRDFNGNIIDTDNIDKKAGLSPFVNLFGFFGQISLSLKVELKKYLKQDGVKKIMCTYDQLPILNKIINPDNYRLLVDEYHCLLKAYSYRSRAINGAKQQYLKEMKKSANQSYIHYDKSTAKFILNDILPKYELYIYFTNKIIYANKHSLRKYYKEQGAIISKIKWEKIDESMIKRIIAKKRFKDVFDEYAELRQSMFSFGDSQQKEIEEDYPFIKLAFDKLGIEGVKKLKYNQKAIKNKLVTVDKDKKADDKVFSLLKPNLTMGTFYSNDDLVTMIEKATRNFKIKNGTIIKAMHIKKWFDANDSTKRINGKVTRGYIINNPLIIYKQKNGKNGKNENDNNVSIL